jgi:hypothetical protein
MVIPDSAPWKFSGPGLALAAGEQGKLAPPQQLQPMPMVRQTTKCVAEKSLLRGDDLVYLVVPVWFRDGAE